LPWTEKKSFLYFLSFIWRRFLGKRNIIGDIVWQPLQQWVDLLFDRDGFMRVSVGNLAVDDPSPFPKFFGVLLALALVSPLCEGMVTQALCLAGIV
jgi:hypothetical protein